MCVIHNHQKRLPLVNSLETPRNIFKIRDALFDFRNGNFQPDSCADGRKYVVNVDFSNERRTNLNFPCRSLRREFKAAEIQCEFLRGQIRAALQPISQRATGKPFQLRGVGIVSVNDGSIGRARACARKERALRGKIIFEALVIIEMIARQVRENRHGEMAAP